LNTIHLGRIKGQEMEGTEKNKAYAHTSTVEKKKVKELNTAIDQKETPEFKHNNKRKKRRQSASNSKHWGQGF